jgi:hypothetical protein
MGRAGWDAQTAALGKGKLQAHPDQWYANVTSWAVEWLLRSSRTSRGGRGGSTATPMQTDACRGRVVTF